MIGSGVKLTVFLWKVESSEILLVEAFGRITTLHPGISWVTIFGCGYFQFLCEVIFMRLQV